MKGWVERFLGLWRLEGIGNSIEFQLFWMGCEITWRDQMGIYSSQHIYRNLDPCVFNLELFVGDGIFYSLSFKLTNCVDTLAHSEICLVTSSMEFYCFNRFS